jgi:MraZ protein
LVGEDFHTLDGKGRVVMPSKYRHELEGGCVVTKGRDGQLLIYTTAAFERKSDEIDALPDTPENRDLTRTFFGGADIQTMDKAGRILVKPELRGYAGLDPGEEVALVGIRKGIEVWSKPKYLAIRDRAEQTYQARGG